MSERLLAATRFVRIGSRAADIGTDHAYLPIYLTREGICGFAVASDIREEPCKRALSNVVFFGASDKVSVVRTDGLAGIEDYSVNDIIIAGMGGELIASIINSADFVRSSKIRLILQPMTRPEVLRGYLLSERFNIINESLSCDNKIFSGKSKIYQCFCAEFDVSESENMPAERYSPAELLLGRHNITRGGELFNILLAQTRERCRVVFDAKKSAGYETEYEQMILLELEEIANGHRA